jgi:hypothetical protein
VRGFCDNCVEQRLALLCHFGLTEWPLLILLYIYDRKCGHAAHLPAETVCIRFGFCRVTGKRVTSQSDQNEISVSHNSP